MKTLKPDQIEAAMWAAEHAESYPIYVTAEGGYEVRRLIILNGDIQRDDRFSFICPDMEMITDFLVVMLGCDLIERESDESPLIVNTYFRIITLKPM